AALRRGPCPCGRTLVKMSKVTGRRDDMLIIRGVNVYPSEVERVLLAEPALAPDYLLVIDEREPLHHLLACLEYETPPSQASPSPSDISRRLHEALGLTVSVRVLPPGSIPRPETGKAVRVMRWNGGPPPLPGLA
ncbi:MAG: phenylacetate--CoA ligase family protein, partial [Streptosporangiaceae bacterium]